MKRREDHGTAIVEFVWLALLLLVPLIYVVLTVFEVQRTAYAASAASRSAGRAFVTAPDQASARQRALVAARLAFADQGLTADRVGISIRCAPDPDRCLVPGSVVTVLVEGSARLPLLPDFLGGSVPRISISAEHASPYGQFREERP